MLEVIYLIYGFDIFIYIFFLRSEYVLRQYDFEKGFKSRDGGRKLTCIVYDDAYSWDMQIDSWYIQICKLNWKINVLEMDG